MWKWKWFIIIVSLSYWQKTKEQESQLSWGNFLSTRTEQENKKANIFQIPATCIFTNKIKLINFKQLPYHIRIEQVCANSPRTERNRATDVCFLLSYGQHLWSFFCHYKDDMTWLSITCFDLVFYSSEDCSRILQLWFSKIMKPHFAVQLIGIFLNVLEVLHHKSKNHRHKI